ncbi:MAG: beta-galactosidase [Actinomycetota bacterium]|nr:beta-galactosidase [Actinomycetota bacterium]
MDTSKVGVTDPLLGSGLYYGGDYNPEQWDRDTWLEDVELMQRARVNLVSVGIFSWSRLEIEEGKFDFDWLDEVLQLLYDRGVFVDLATATASPPAWLIKKDPTILPVDHEGRRLSFGARQSYCPNSISFRSAAASLVEHLVDRYSDFPGLRMWHVSNEYGCHVSRCYCEQCEKRFRIWLQRRYGSVELLNRAWGSAFWSQLYGEFDEISPPRIAPTFCNPTQQLDYFRFASDSIKELYEMEVEIIRRRSSKPITTNYMGFFKGVDQFAWRGIGDFVSLDSYPDPHAPEVHIDAAAGYDLTRSVAQGEPWLLMEQAPSAVNWRGINGVKKPGQMRALSMSAVARGANGVMFFQWRAAKAGAEKFHSAMLPHSGADSRIYREVVQLGEDLSKLSAVTASKVVAEVAIAFDWNNWWAIELDSHPTDHIFYLLAIRKFYGSLQRLGVTCDFVSPKDDLTGYKAVLTPNLYLCSQEFADRIASYVAAGGSVLGTYFTGIVDQNDHIVLGGYPGYLRELFGVVVEEFAPLRPGESFDFTITKSPTIHRGTIWSEVVKATTADVLATAVAPDGADDSFDCSTRGVLFENLYGAGRALYLSTEVEDEFLDLVIERLLGEDRELSSPRGVEVVRRGEFTFVINHGDDFEFALNRRCRDLLTGNTISEAVSLKRFDVLVLEDL